jgi:hypothetical protein
VLIRTRSLAYVPEACGLALALRGIRNMPGKRRKGPSPRWLFCIKIDKLIARSGGATNSGFRTECSIRLIAIVSFQSKEPDQKPAYSDLLAVSRQYCVELPMKRFDSKHHDDARFLHCRPGLPLSRSRPG